MKRAALMLATVGTLAVAAAPAQARGWGHGGWGHGGWGPGIGFGLAAGALAAGAYGAYGPYGYYDAPYGYYGGGPYAYYGGPRYYRHYYRRHW